MWVDNTQVPEVLETIVTDKDCREIMIAFQKAIKQAKNNAMTSIIEL
jgi:hypothetical protein